MFGRHFIQSKLSPCPMPISSVPQEQQPRHSAPSTFLMKKEPPLDQGRRLCPLLLPSSSAVECAEPAGIVDPSPSGTRKSFTRIAVLLASAALGGLLVNAVSHGRSDHGNGTGQRVGTASLIRRRGIIRRGDFNLSDGTPVGFNADNDSDAFAIDQCNAACCSSLFPLRYKHGSSDSTFYPDESFDIGRFLEEDVSSANYAKLAEADCPPPPADEGSVTSNLPKAVTWILVVLLVCLSALFSGLTLGLMSLDKTGLEIVMEGGDPELSKAAKKIYPVRKNGNRLLCTLLLGNVAVNALLSILMADVAGGLAGFLVSTAVIVIFGEILPQALCSRYALQIGSRTIPIIKVIMFLMFPLAAPLGWALDKILGHELGTTYSKAEMTKLLEIHVKEGRFNQETGTAMAGALLYQDMAVKEVMTPIDNTYMLAADARLGYDVIAEIFKTGFSRIPVYEVSRNNVIGLLFTKDLIFIDPEDETPVRSFVEIFGRGLHVVWPDDKLGDILRDLKKGHSHMALVRDVNNEDSLQDPYYEIRGIITLEDIIEVILGDDIVDETDAFVDGTHSIKVDRSSADFDWARLRLLDAKLVDETLADAECKAVTAHLRTNYAESVELLSDSQLRRLVAETPVTELKEPDQEVGEDFPKELLYEKGVPADVCTLILSGKVTVLAGSEMFRADVSSWSVLAPNALTDPNFAPDFTAYVSSDPCRVLRFSRHEFTAAVDASAAEKYGHAAVAVPTGTIATGTNSDMLQSDDTEHNRSVTVDMGKKDVHIGLGDKSQSDLVIDVDQFDKVKISSEPSAEGTTRGVNFRLEGEAQSTAAVMAGASTKASKEAAVLIVEPEIPIRTEDKTEVAEAALAKREFKRKQHQRHRSKLLAAFMTKKKSPDETGDDIETVKEGEGETKEGAPSTTVLASAGPQLAAAAASPSNSRAGSAPDAGGSAEASSGQSESSSMGRDRSSSVGFLKELSVRQSKDENQ